MTDEQVTELNNIIEGLYGDDREALLDAIHDLALQAGPKVVKRFLKANIKDITESDLMDPSVYKRVQVLVSVL